MKSRLVLLASMLVTLSCAEVNYIGESYPPTDRVDIFYDEKNIHEEYTIIGQAIGSGKYGIENDKIMDKLVEEAKSKGAHALLITGLEKDNFTSDDGPDGSETQIKASFLIYDRMKTERK